MKRIIPLARTLTILASRIAIAWLLCTLVRDSCISGEPDHDELTGKWAMERAVHGGPGFSFEEPRRNPNPKTLTFHKGWFLSESPKDGKRYFTYRVNKATKPYEFDIWYAQNEEDARKPISHTPDLWGIYEIREGHLWRCYTTNNNERPKDFEVFDHDAHVFTVHSRVGKPSTHK
jgi:uncharacterized protein (TIGR03067 family)